MSIEIYYIPEETNSDEIIRMLKDGGYIFTKKNVAEHSEFRTELESMEGKPNTPTLVINGKIYENVTPDKARSALKKIETED